MFLLPFTCNYLVSVRRSFLFLLVLGMGCVMLLWHSLVYPFNYFELSVLLKRFTDLLHSTIHALYPVCMTII